MMVNDALDIKNDDEVMTTTEVMKYLKVSRKTVLKLVREGKIPAQKVGKDFRYLKNEVQAFLRGSAPMSDSLEKSYFHT